MDSIADRFHSLGNRISLIHYELHRRLGVFYAVIIYSLCLFCLSFLAIVTNMDGSPFKNQNTIYLNKDMSDNTLLSNIPSIFPSFPPTENSTLFSNQSFPTSFPTTYRNAVRSKTNPNDTTGVSSGVLLLLLLMGFWGMVQSIRLQRRFNALHNNASNESIAAMFNLMNSADNHQLTDEAFQRRLRIMLTRRDFNANDYDMLQQLDEESNGIPLQNIRTNRRGADQNVIDQLPSHIIESNERNEDVQYCAICLGPFETGETIRTLLCLHQFHLQCSDQWLRQNACCPVCKVSILATD